MFFCTAVGVPSVLLLALFALPPLDCSVLAVRPGFLDTVALFLNVVFVVTFYISFPPPSRPSTPRRFVSVSVCFTLSASLPFGGLHSKMCRCQRSSLSHSQSVSLSPPSPSHTHTLTPLPPPPYHPHPPHTVSGFSLSLCLCLSLCVSLSLFTSVVCLSHTHTLTGLARFYTHNL